MLVSRWGNSLGVRLRRALVDSLSLKSGGKLDVVSATPERIEVKKDMRRAEAIARMRARGLCVPEGYVFDRSDANAR